MVPTLPIHCSCKQPCNAFWGFVLPAPHLHEVKDKGSLCKPGAALATNRYGVKVKTNSAAYFSPKMYKDTHFWELNLIVPSVKHENRTFFERETRLLT